MCALGALAAAGLAGSAQGRVVRFGMCTDHSPFELSDGPDAPPWQALVLRTFQ